MDGHPDPNQFNQILRIPVRQPEAAVRFRPSDLFRAGRAVYAVTGFVQAYPRHAHRGNRKAQLIGNSGVALAQSDGHGLGVAGIELGGNIVELAVIGVSIRVRPGLVEHILSAAFGTSSIERAAIMFTLIAIARQFRLSSNMYNTLAATALITLVINPFDLFDMGFQLSYLAIIGIFYFTKKADELYRPQSWLLYKAWELVVVSLAAQALTLPLCLYYFGQIPVYFIITNLITIPVTFAVMILGIAVVPLYYVSQSLFHLVSMLLQTSVFIQNYTVKTIAHFPFATIHYCTSFGITLAMYAAIVCCGYLFERRRFI